MVNNSLVKVLILVLYVAENVESANILFFHVVGSYSHRTTTYPLADALAKQGHNVFYLNPFENRGPLFNPNVTEIVPKSFGKLLQGMLDVDLDVNNRVTQSFPRMVNYVPYVAIELCQSILDSLELQQFYETTKSIDLVVIDNCFSDCGAIVAHKYGAKIVMYHTVSHYPFEFDLWGMASESSSIPEVEVRSPPVPMSFFQRVFNALISIHFRWVYLKHMEVLDNMGRKHLKDPNMPFLDEIMRNASLILYPIDFISDYPRSHAPFVVDLGGIYCVNTSKPLPQELAEFLEENPKSEGFVYISLGSIAKSSKLPEKTIQVFMETVRHFPEIQFVWKWNSPIPEDKPKNVYLAKWFPQTSVLAHPKIKAFVTQAGRPSTMEALCNAVPTISFPVLGDQDAVANRMTQMGVSQKLELATVTTEEFVDAISRIVYNNTRQERVTELKNILLDRPKPPMETAIWWVEYVLRHKDTSHLRPAGFEQNWFQRRLLDVWLFVYTVLLISVLISYYACAFVLKYLVMVTSSWLNGKGKVKKS